MNTNLILLLVTLLICLQLTLAKEKARATATIYSLKDVDQYWTSFKQKHQYVKKLNNEMERKAKFVKNLIKINEHNARYNNGSETYYLGITRFADWDSQEFASFVKSGGLNKKMIPKNVTNLETASIANANNAAPSSIDWRNYNGQSYVQAIKDQGQCGSCWAFSAVSALESYAALSNNGSYLPNLSEQNLVDCVYDFDTCDYGGNVLEAWDYILMNGGIATESNYPYKSGSSETVS
jgi:C1A family cysteine protease